MKRVDNQLLKAHYTVSKISRNDVMICVTKITLIEVAGVERGNNEG
jgi:hypothetical protein